MLRQLRSHTPSIGILLAMGGTSVCIFTEIQSRLETSTSSTTSIVDDIYKPSFSERLIGNYENRLRKFSSPERVFEYFSSVEIDKQSYMTREDLARAITPFTYRHGTELSSKNSRFNFHAKSNQPSKEIIQEYTKRIQNLLVRDERTTKNDIDGFLKYVKLHEIDYETHVRVLRSIGIKNIDFEAFLTRYGGSPIREKSFFDLIDGDGDGLISYAEYMFFNTILTIPERQFELAFRMFDADGNGRLDHREFKQIMEMMRTRTPAGRQDRSLQSDDIPLFPHLFGEFATETLEYSKFRAFREQLHQEIWKIQFEQFDVDASKTLNAREFAIFLVSHANQHEVEHYLERIKALEHVKGDISLEEFMHFSQFLNHLDEMEVAMELLVSDSAGLNKEQFQRATRAALHAVNEQRTTKNEWLITDLQVQILFALFDDNNDGHLSPEEFISVMKKRKNNGFNEPRDTGTMAFIQKLITCLDKVL